MTALSGWGRRPVVETDLRQPASLEALAADLRAGGAVARGNGRSYGDAALGAGRTLSMLGFDRMRSFDPATGVLTAESGVLLSDVIDALLPRGWLPAVVPGTRYVTIGGSIAADVHGKNHHRDGGFGDTVERIALLLPDGARVEASRSENAELFAATIGGMGLTGVILDASIRLRPVETGWIRRRTVAARDLASALAALDAADGATYSVAWIDCLARGASLGRSLVFLGEHARADEVDPGRAALFPLPGPPRVAVPVDLPGFALNPLAMRLFNALYFRSGARDKTPLVGVGPYFFPLDGVGNWNRMYGRRGFAQHQCVLPRETAPAALAEILAAVSARGDASFLAVLKTLGRGGGLLSFPMPGYTLALDFPWTDRLEAFLDRLDAIVVRAGGRLYLAKDARQSRATFEAGYPALAGFRAIRRAVDPDRRLRSHLSERLEI